MGTRFNWWCPPELRKQCQRNLTNSTGNITGEDSDFSDNLSSNYRQRNFLNQIKCYRCREIGHFAKNCTCDRKIKYSKKIERDRQRLMQYIQGRTCSDFPFVILDNAKFYGLLTIHICIILDKIFLQLTQSKLNWRRKELRTQKKKPLPKD
ncbi:unnamed protein product [Mytilus coruscus]|uniref:CCHC-type domain-containing protein n=1 Tax=Mytilus coruscus TaxID=42192 RepID=A0A6J8ADM3_MYTCO|nr:unnamed protein product [Mytilus coruscus]